jgi:hypothetical protein
MTIGPIENEVRSLTFKLDYRHDYATNEADYPRVAALLQEGWKIESVHIHPDTSGLAVSVGALITFVMTFGKD